MTYVRVADPSDATAVAAIGRDAFVRQYESLVDPTNYLWAVDRWYSDAGIETSIRDCAHDPAALFLVAESDGEIAGFLHYDETGPQPELHRIYLAAEQRGRGTGALLMNALHEGLSDGASYVLVVVEGNDRAVRFYESNGLREEDRVSGHAYYCDTAGLAFPAEAQDFRMVLMRYASDERCRVR